MTKVKDNYYYAKRFGWEEHKGANIEYWWKPGIKYWEETVGPLPTFTASLDQIVREIKRRGERFEIFTAHKSVGGFTAHILDEDGEWVGGANAATAPLALCEALDAYLQEEK